jgi:hypothetical protein
MGVPNTTTFSMNDVKLAVGNYSTLADLFKQANSNLFDPAYSGNKDNLLNFRNYGNTKVWQQFNAFGIDGSYNSKNCQPVKTNYTLYFFSNNSYFSTGDLVSTSSSGKGNASQGWYYTNIHFNAAILVGLDKSNQSFIKQIIFCTPP